MARATALDRLPGASFAGFRFPVRELHVRGSLRHHVHEYPHAAGGAFEGLGRRLYEFRMTCPFHDTFRAYPKLYPETLASLRVLFEGGGAWDLVVPSIGTVQARCIDWTQHLFAKVRSGEDVELVFLEDRDEMFLIDKLVSQSNDLAPPGETLAELVRARDTSVLLTGLDELARDAALVREESLFERLFVSINVLTSLDDQAELYGTLLATTALDAVRLCEEIDRSCKSLSQPESYHVLDALHEVWAGAARLHADAMSRGRVLREMITPSLLLTVSQVTAKIYGATERTVEVLKLNDFDDALAIPPRTRVRYYE